MDGAPYEAGHGRRRGWGRGRGGRGGGGRRFSGPPPSAERTREMAAQQLQQSLFRLGDADAFNAVEELPRVARWLHAQSFEFPEAVYSALRIMVTEQPHKIPLTAALVGILVLEAPPAPPAPEGAPQPPASLGKRILTNLITGFERDLDAHYWRNVRLELVFFAALIPLGIISASSVRAALRELARVLSAGELAPASGADQAAMCIVDTLCRAGTDLLQPDPAGTGEAGDARVPPKEQLNALVEAVSTYGAQRGAQPELVSPFRLSDLPEELAFLQVEAFEHRVQALETLRDRGYIRPAFIPSTTDLLPAGITPVGSSVPAAERTASVPEVRIAAVPHATAAYHEGEAVDARAAVGLRPDTGKGPTEIERSARGPDRVGRAARWFDSESVPVPGSVSAVVLRGIVLDMVDLYVINRKEAAQALLSLPLWMRRGTFGGNVPPYKGLFGEEGGASWHVEGDGAEYSLEDLLVETVLAEALLLPTAPQLPLYYSSLLREIVSAAPQQVAPSLGRTMRRLHAASGAARVDGEVLRRLADWFSVHLSNFNFTWAWPEWAGDASLPWTHAQRALDRRLVELEVRLAYYDRIKGTVPEELQEALMPAEEPAPVYTYAHAEHPYHARAMLLFNSIKAKASVQVVQADLQSFAQSIVVPAGQVPSPEEEQRGMVDDAAQADEVVRDVVVQTLLNAGSRSFSHLLNVVERYHDLLRALSTTPAARVTILASTARFWARSAQWVLIVFDKLLQYRIVEPVDVVTYVFSPPSDAPGAVLLHAGNSSAFSFSADATELGGTLRDWSSFNWWLVLRLTVEKVVGRVGQLTQRVGATATAAPPSNAPIGAPPADASLPARPTDVSYSAASAAGVASGSTTSQEEAKVHLDAVALEQRRVLVSAMSGFIQLLQQHRAFDAQPASAADADAPHTWQAWWIAQWYTEFVRLFHAVLATNRETILANVFAATPADDAALRTFEQACTLAEETASTGT